MLDKSQAELEIDRGELTIAVKRACMEKTALQGQLSEINAALKVTLPMAEYQKLNSKRGNVIRQISDKEAEVFELKAKAVEIHAAIEITKQQRMSHWNVRQIVIIRDKWHAFSMDSAQHYKAREAAWAFSQELKGALAEHFKP